jgi:release factor glutamine methyltransferase
MIVDEVIRKYKTILKNSKIETYTLDCRILLAHVLGVKANNLRLYKNDEINGDDMDRFEKMIQRRLNFEPVSKIINKKTFWEYDFFVNEDVLDPRPDSENMIELILCRHDRRRPLKILDLGTGSGCLILTLLKIFKNSSGVAVDINEKALTVAKYNAELLGVQNISFIKSNWNDEINEKFDIIISNPPYIKTGDIDGLKDDVKKFDPIISLDGGEDGLDCYRYIAKNILKNCFDDTNIYLEIGYVQIVEIMGIFEKENFYLDNVKKDLRAINRILCFKLC